MKIPVDQFQPSRVRGMNDAAIGMEVFFWFWQPPTQTLNLTSLLWN